MTGVNTPYNPRVFRLILSIVNSGISLATPQQGRPNRACRILVVDDDDNLRLLNAQVLAHSGYHVDAATDGAAAWDSLQRADYDLLITDNNMPKVSGVELLHKLHAAHIAMPVILVTGIPPKAELTRYPWLQPAALSSSPIPSASCWERSETSCARPSLADDKICPENFHALVLRGVVGSRGRNRFVPLRRGIKFFENFRLVVRERNHSLSRIQNRRQIAMLRIRHFKTVGFGVAARRMDVRRVAIRPRSCPARCFCSFFRPVPPFNSPRPKEPLFRADNKWHGSRG